MQVIAERTVAAEFDGADYDPARDGARLSSQYREIFDLMKDGSWRTMREIERLTGHPQPSISAQLRHARKPRFGSHTVNKEYLGDGLYRYQLVVREEIPRAAEPVRIAAPLR